MPMAKNGRCNRRIEKAVFGEWCKRSAHRVDGETNGKAVKVVLVDEEGDIDDNEDERERADELAHREFDKLIIFRQRIVVDEAVVGEEGDEKRNAGAEHLRREIHHAPANRPLFVQRNADRHGRIKVRARQMTTRKHKHQQRRRWRAREHC
jgi:hypothetical protein